MSKNDPLIIRIIKRDGVVTASWASRKGEGATCEEALTNLGKELDVLMSDFIALVKEDLIEQARDGDGNCT